MKKRIIIILIITALLTTYVTPVSAMALKSATVEILDEEWDIESDTQYDTFSTANGGFGITFEGSGWWIFRSSTTFILTEETLQYESGWWIWKTTGEVEELDLDENSTSFYEEAHIWCVEVDGKKAQFFSYQYNDSLFDYGNDTNATLMIFGFTTDRGVTGVMYESDMSIITAKEATLSDMYKYSQYMGD